jgi:hypothetical protein
MVGLMNGKEEVPIRRELDGVDGRRLELRAVPVGVLGADKDEEQGGEGASDQDPTVMKGGSMRVVHESLSDGGA